MKIILIALSLITVATAHAETVVDTIGSSKNWSAAKIEDHKAWQTEACIASTTTGSARLEVYAEAQDTGGYVEPTIQIVLTKQVTTYSAEATDQRGQPVFHFTLVNKSNQPADVQVLAARLGDREALIERLRNALRFQVKLKDATGKFVRTIDFSLSGSQKTIDTQFEACQLEIL